MRRREFITLFGGAAASWPLAARAQQASIAKVGLLWPGAGPPVSPRMESFREGLRRSGYVEGQNVTIELRYAEPGQEQLAGHAADLVRANVDVIATFGDGGTKIAQGDRHSAGAERLQSDGAPSPPVPRLAPTSRVGWVRKTSDLQLPPQSLRICPSNSRASSPPPGFAVSISWCELRSQKSRLVRGQKSDPTG